jgi:hypothetical protein
MDVQVLNINNALLMCLRCIAIVFQAGPVERKWQPPIHGAEPRRGATEQRATVLNVHGFMVLSIGLE